MAKLKNPNTGRPPRFKKKEELQKKIDDYFQECEGTLLLDKEGRPVYTEKGALVYLTAPKPPTVTGLALALGFLSRQALLNYQGKQEFHDTITRAKSYIEEYTERRLFDRDGVQGAKFSLMNNFRGWAEKQQTTLSREEREDDPMTKSLKEELDRGTF